MDYTKKWMFLLTSPQQGNPFPNGSNMCFKFSCQGKSFPHKAKDCSYNYFPRPDTRGFALQSLEEIGNYFIVNKHN